MKLINVSNLLEKNITVKQIKQIDKNGFTEFMYSCQCGAKHVDVYITKNTLINKTNKVCRWCGKTNTVPCRIN